MAMRRRPSAPCASASRTWPGSMRCSAISWAALAENASASLALSVPSALASSLRILSSSDRRSLIAAPGVARRPRDRGRWSDRSANQSRRSAERQHRGVDAPSSPAARTRSRVAGSAGGRGASPAVQFVEPSTSARRSSVQASIHPAAVKSAGPGPSGPSLKSPAIIGRPGSRLAASTHDARPPGGGRRRRRAATGGR